jgi:hypothetical protein
MSDDDRCNVGLSYSPCNSWKGNTRKRQRGSRHCNCLEDDTKILEHRVQFTIGKRSLGLVVAQTTLMRGVRVRALKSPLVLGRRYSDKTK